VVEPHDAEVNPHDGGRPWAGAGVTVGQRHQPGTDVAPNPAGSWLVRRSIQVWIAAAVPSLVVVPWHSRAAGADQEVQVRALVRLQDVLGVQAGVAPAGRRLRR
jgi:hypothetical protein